MEKEIIQNNQPSYYANITAKVRYDEDLCANAKLLYGEITALANKEGYSWATNDYFAKLYKVSKVSVSKWINQLVGKGHIISQIIRDEGTKQILERRLYINDPALTPIKEKFNRGIKEKFNRGIKEKFKDNSTSINTTRNNIYIAPIKEKNDELLANKKIPTRDLVETYVKQNQLDINVETFYNYYNIANWKDNKGKFINWQQKLLMWKTNNFVTPKSAKQELRKDPSHKIFVAPVENDSTLKVNLTSTEALSLLKERIK